MLFAILPCCVSRRNSLLELDHSLIENDTVGYHRRFLQAIAQTVFDKLVNVVCHNLADRFGCTLAEECRYVIDGVVNDALAHVHGICDRRRLARLDAHMLITAYVDDHRSPPHPLQVFVVEDVVGAEHIPLHRVHDDVEFADLFAQ